MSGRVITLIIFIVIIFSYVVYNTHPVGVKFLWWEFRVSTALTTIGSLLVVIIWGSSSPR